jgi:NAD+ diphosphatase
VKRDDLVFCIRGKDILMSSCHEKLSVPVCEQVWQCTSDSDWESWDEEQLRYVFRFQGKNCFLWMGVAGECMDSELFYTPARTMRELGNSDLCFAAMTAWHLYNWYRVNRFCGNCGCRTVHDGRERMLRCPECGNMIFPRINPAVIVAVTDGDRLVLTKYAGRAYTRYALIAGFTEIGETLEQTVQREVMEEVGLQVKNIRYYKSQPWGIDGNILMGFYCDLDGDDTVTLDREELAVAEWHHRSNLPAKDDGFSLTREMIRVFKEGREPKG